MADFFIYLFESSICLSILYLGYVMLFKKETYFNFIRTYLLLSLFLALSIPLIRVNISPTNNKINEQIEAIGTFKSYYEQIIYLTDPSIQADEPGPRQEKQARIVNANIPIWLSNNRQTIQGVAKVFLIIYSAGFIFFVLRFFYLLAWLFMLIKKHGIIEFEGLKVIQTDKEMPSFSFLNFLFVNRNGLTEEEFLQVIAHERTHIKQWHSADLLMVYLVSLFQWFNPLVWRLQKAFKTTHEYIADQKVVEQGYELLDYQSLLLRQLISIRSVELVNNFNLLSIKKRIAMMNKIKSGFLSKMKALISLPFILFAFIMLADMSCDMAPMVKDELKVTEEKVEYPELSQARLLDESKVNLTIAYNKDFLAVNGEVVELNKLSDYLSKYDETVLRPAKQLGVLLEIYNDVPMDNMDIIKQALRENQLYKIIYKSYKNTGKQSNDFYGLGQLLPPMNAKFLEEDVIKEQGIYLYKIATFDNKSLETVKTELSEIIVDKEKYVLMLQYNNSTNYLDYMNYTNTIYEVINNRRDIYAKAEFGKSFLELEKDVQKTIRKKYPITLTMKNVDQDE